MRKDIKFEDFSIYRGLMMTEEQINEYKNAKVNLYDVNLNGFASTSQDKNLALKFTFPEKQQEKMKSVLIQIDVKLKPGFPFACLFMLGEDYSVFPKE